VSGTDEGAPDQRDKAELWGRCRPTRAVECAFMSLGDRSGWVSMDTTPQERTPVQSWSNLGKVPVTVGREIRVVR
jgi:hypothetical protein